MVSGIRSANWQGYPTATSLVRPGHSLPLRTLMISVADVIALGAVIAVESWLAFRTRPRLLANLASLVH
jgi:hypothetical protein